MNSGQPDELEVGSDEWWDHTNQRYGAAMSDPEKRFVIEAERNEQDGTLMDDLADEPPYPSNPSLSD